MRLELALSLALSLLTSSALAQPAITRPVTDEAGVLSSAAVADLEARLAAHHDAGHAQIALLFVRTTAGVPIADYTLRVAEAWGGGSHERDDGLLFVLAVEDHEMRIEVGYGLEPTITDGVASHVLDELVPLLRDGDFDRAAWRVADALVSRTGGESLPAPDWPAAPASRVADRAPTEAEPVDAPTDAFRAPTPAATDWGPSILLVLVVVVSSLAVFVFFWRSSNTSYDSDGIGHTPWRSFPVGTVLGLVGGAAAVLGALVFFGGFAMWMALVGSFIGFSILRGLGSSGGGSGGGSRSRSMDSSSSHRSSPSRSPSSSHRASSYGGGSSYGGSSGRSYGGGGGGFGGGGASKRW